MPVNLKGRSFLTLKDFTPDEIRYMLNLAADLKAKKRAGIRGNLLAGKNIVLLFEKTSTRTRCAFEVAAYDEGANVTFLDSKSSQMGKKETMVDTAKVLGRFYDGIEYRGYDQKVVEGLAANAGVPVWNGLTDVDHPTQALADILTLMENTKKPLSKCKLVFCGDTRNNVAYCLMYICAKLGIHYVGWGPKELAPAADVVEYCREVGKETGAVVEYGEDRELIKGADALYTDIWASMGEEEKIPERVKLLTPYKVTGHRESRLHLPALPAVLPRLRHHDGRFAEGARLRYPRGHGRGLPLPELQGLRRGREPHAHDQGRHGRDDRQRLICSGRFQKSIKEREHFVLPFFFRFVYCSSAFQSRVSRSSVHFSYWEFVLNS